MSPLYTAAGRPCTAPTSVIEDFDGEAVGGLVEPGHHVPLHHPGTGLHEELLGPRLVGPHVEAQLGHAGGVGAAARHAAADELQVAHVGVAAPALPAEEL